MYLTCLVFPTEVVLCVSEILTPQEVEILRCCPCCAAVLLKSAAAKAVYLEDSVRFHSSLVAKESRLWLLIGRS